MRGHERKRGKTKETREIGKGNRGDKGKKEMRFLRFLIPKVLLHPWQYHTVLCLILALLVGVRDVTLFVGFKE